MKNALEPSRPGAIADGGTARQLAASSTAENNPTGLRRGARAPRRVAGRSAHRSKLQQRCWSYDHLKSTACVIWGFHIRNVGVCGMDVENRPVASIQLPSA